MYENIERLVKHLEDGDQSVFEQLAREIEREGRPSMVLTILIHLRAKNQMLVAIQWIEHIAQNRSLNKLKKQLIAEADQWPEAKISVDVLDCLSGDWRYIPPGVFAMGSPESEIGRQLCETQHEVEIERGFWMQKTPVTQLQWFNVTECNPSFFQNDADSDQRPVETIDWYDAVAFCNMLSKDNGLEFHYGSVHRNPMRVKKQPKNPLFAKAQSNLGYYFFQSADDTKHIDVDIALNFNSEGYRLPTEAEWEYACRAGTDTAFYREDTERDQIAWYKKNARRSTHPVRQKKPNGWGLYDMSGNVCEWCANWFEASPSEQSRDPTHPVIGSGRIIRGGSWMHKTNDIRSASRFCYEPSFRSKFIGLRLVRSD